MKVATLSLPSLHDVGHTLIFAGTLLVRYRMGCSGQRRPVPHQNHGFDFVG